MSELGFDEDIRPLFRESDRLEMDFVFDLWSHDDVTANADRILERLEDGTMPCDAPWPDERIQLFRAWIDGGCAP
jgi:hypothetical protein